MTTVRLDDMRLFAAIARLRSFTAAARELGMPKQTLSRRIAELEQALDVQLLHRTTRKLHLTEVGAAYAGRCVELVRLADDAHRDLGDAQRVPRGELRVTADPVFGDAFLPGLVTEYATRWPEVHVEVLLTRRRVDLVEEGVDVAVRIGHVDDPQLVATRLGPARVRYCASPAYLQRRGIPSTPEQLRDHDCILVGTETGPVRWPFRARTGPRGSTTPRLVPVAGRMRTNSFTIAHAAALAGLGIAIFPEFACAEDLRAGQLVAVLDDWLVEVGAVSIVHARSRSLPVRVRTFVELAIERLARTPPWVLERPRARRRS